MVEIRCLNRQHFLIYTLRQGDKSDTLLAGKAIPEEISGLMSLAELGRARGTMDKAYAQAVSLNFASKRARMP
ncbi:hypothetical protein [Massilia sp. TSP1-1-2]|uniref:hypothetical protein n=1 Tax=Massilia sp. TSP1-1-2 TaxID=2804649 RepID=UPI003CF3EBAF